MIGKVNKYIFWGVKEEIDDFLLSAQRKGIIEFVEKDSSKRQRPSAEVQELFTAIKILKQYSPTETEQVIPSLESEVAKKDILDTQVRLDNLYDERRGLFSQIAHISPFGDFSKEDIDYLAQEGNRFIQFFCKRTSKEAQALPHPDLIYIGTEYDLDYYICISKEHVQIPKMIEVFIEKPVGKLKIQLEEVKQTIAFLEKHLKTMVSYLPLLRKELLIQLDAYHLGHAKDLFIYPMEEDLFVIEAWIPDRKKKDVDLIVRDRKIFYEAIEPDKTDRIPTYMENKNASRIGEDLVNIYDTPSTNDKDPSLWVLVSFAIFFAMIISDAGYGLLYCLLGFLLLWKIPKPKPQGKRLIKLVFLLAMTTTAWGMVTGTFFGMNFDPKSTMNKINMLQVLAEKKAGYYLSKKDATYDYWLKKYPQVKEAKTGEEMLLAASFVKEGKVKYEMQGDLQDGILMELALIVGILHLTLSFLRYLKRSWAGVGWILCMIGGYLYFPVFVDSISLAVSFGLISEPVSHQLGLQLLYGGLAAAFLLALIQKGLMGFMEIINMVQVFADVLSYLRLYALALASVIFATTFNEMGQSMGYVLGFIVIIIGHAINILLGIMGGVIHGLRLNFIEWYHYSFEGDGRLFHPLKLNK